MQYNKLVRDKIPDLIKEKGEALKTHVADDMEYWTALNQKLLEEVNEFLEAESEEELADILEVLDAIVAYKKFDDKNIQGIKDKKALERGRFEKRIILEES